MPWELAFVASAGIAVPYLAISGLIARGLAKSGQLTSNKLGAGTALMFFSCGVGHGLHALHLLEAQTFRAAIDPHMILWDLSTAGIAIYYFSLRGRYGQLLQGTTLFDDHERLAAAAEAHHNASHDHLTGLANRAAFMEAADRALGPEAPPSARAVLFLDLDGFKEVNDRHGHGAGDELLTAAGERLARALPSGDLVARLGGDEFAVLLGGGASPESAAVVARRLARALSAPFSVLDEKVTLTVSTGITTARPGEATAAQLLHQADEAMYDAKAKGRARWEIYNWPGGATLGSTSSSRMHGESSSASIA